MQALIDAIPILPTRHGNTSLLLPPHHKSRYSDPTYEAWKPSFLFQAVVSKHIPILPTRHGNLAGSLQLPLPIRYSDPTYEAWKLCMKLLKVLRTINSDPTYEAWKLEKSHKHLWGGKNSDPTYEAWKQEYCGNIV